MLFTPLVRPLDLLGTSELNRAVDERHFISSESDRIFVPQLGPFFKDSMIVVDVLSGKTLVEHEDYRLIHMVSAATDESNKEIVTVVYITNNTISEVLLTYQAIGGIYAEGSLALLEILDRFKDAKLPPIYWVNILNLPDKFPVTPHRHTIYDLNALDLLVTALTKVYDSLLGRDIPKFQTLYDNLDKVILELDNRGNDYIQAQEQGFMRIESNILYRKGSIKVTDNNQNPFDYLNYGSWVRLENVLLYGHTPGDNDDPITNIADGSGLVARKTNFWEQISDIDGMSFVLTASATSINEGQSVTFTLRTSGVTEGTSLPYKLDGITQADIVEPISGSFVINALGVATVTITTLEDKLSEGIETMTMYLETYTSIRRSVIINDTSRSPSFNVYYTSDIEGRNIINQIEEGGSFYIFIQSEFVADGQIVNLFYTGSTTSNADFNTTLPTQLTISGGRAVAQVKVKADQLTEGNEILFTGISLSSADAVIASNVLTIRDTSRTPGYNITYTLSDTDVRSLYEIEEGVDFWCIVETENVTNGTVYTVNNAGSVNTADFDTIYPNSIIINNNTAKFKMRMSNDLRTEGAETLAISLMLNGSSVYTKSITVLDSSVNPDANMKFSTNTTGTNNITQANEGDTVYLIIVTQNTPNGTGFNLIYSGSADANDFTEARQSTVTITDNRAVVRFSIKADQITENGDETLIVSLQNQFTRETLGSVSLVIKDTSRMSTYKLRFSNDFNGNGSITNADEGKVVYGILETTDVGNGTVVFIDTTIGGQLATVANGDVTTNVQTSATIQNNFASIKISLNNDMMNEGAEALLMNIRDADGNTLATGTMTVNDTSLAATYAARIVQGTTSIPATADGSATTSLFINMNYGLVIQTTNVADGTVLYIRRNGNVVSGSNFLSDAAYAANGGIAPATTVTINNNQAIIPFKIALAWKDTVDRTLVLGAYLSASGGSPVAQVTATFKTPTWETYFTSDAAGQTKITAVNEGSRAYFIVRTTNVPNDTTINALLYINDVSPSTAVWNEDVSGNPSVAYNITNNLCSTPYDIVADELKEGNEIFRARIFPYIPNNADPVWYQDASITIIDTSYRANKIRAWTTNNNSNLIANDNESFDRNIYTSLITPEGVNEGWTIAPATNLQLLEVDVFNRSGTSRIGYTGVNSVVTIDQRMEGGKFAKWQKSYHNEVITNMVDVTGPTSMGANASHLWFISPSAQHEGWTLTRNATENILSVFNRSGTNRIDYSGRVGLTLMTEYMPHYGDHIDAGYPRIVSAGFSKDNDLIPLYDMFKYNITDTSKYAIMFCPEGTHEGWSLTRSDKGITPSVFNRSGTERIGYLGQNNWALVQLKADSNIDNPRRKIFARAGNFTFDFVAGRSYKVEVIGGGGAGGNAVYYHSGATMVKSGDGGQSSLEIKNVINVSAGGGIGGTRGNWNNGSAFHNGDSGAGGVGTVTTIAAQLSNTVKLYTYSNNTGATGWMNRYRAGAGGKNTACPETNYFAGGGKGMYGSGDDEWGYGGAGGAGGYSSIVFKSIVDQTANIKVGAGGIPFDDKTEYYQANWHFGYGEKGQRGMVIITEFDEVQGSTVDIVLTGTREDSGYYILEEQVDVLKRITTALGRAPSYNDIVTITIPSTTIVLAPTRAQYALYFANFPFQLNIQVNAYGKIFGRGGSIASNYDEAPVIGVGGDAIYSDGSCFVALNAFGPNGAILGGGGTGGEELRGGSGAPYGIGGQYSTPAQLATLFTGGKGAYGFSGSLGGAGGAPGQAGSNGRSSGYGTRVGYDAGKPFVGNNISAIVYK